MGYYSAASVTELAIGHCIDIIRGFVITKGALFFAIIPLLFILYSWLQVATSPPALVQHTIIIILYWHTFINTTAFCQ